MGTLSDDCVQSALFVPHEHRNDRQDFLPLPTAQNKQSYTNRTMADWAFDSGSPAIQASSAAAAGAPDEVADRTSVITGKLKTIYRKTVLPVEKRFKYDYFFESPFLSDVEFDGTYLDVLCSTSIL